jgi:hypothetical protein
VKRKVAEQALDSMSTPTSGLRISLTQRSRRRWIATHLNHSGNEYQDYEEGIADKVPFPWAGSNGLMASRKPTSMNHATPEGSMRGYSAGRPVVPRFFQNTSITVRRRNSQVLVRHRCQSV